MSSCILKLKKKCICYKKCLKKDNSSKKNKMLKVGLLDTPNKFSLLFLIGDKISTGPFNEHSKYHMTFSQAVSNEKIFELVANKNTLLAQVAMLDQI